MELIDFKRCNETAKVIWKRIRIRNVQIWIIQWGRANRHAISPPIIIFFVNLQINRLTTVSPLVLFCALSRIQFYVHQYHINYIQLGTGALLLTKVSYIR